MLHSLRFSVYAYNTANLTGQFSNPRSTPHGGWINLRATPVSLARHMRIRYGESTHRTPLPDAATPFSFSMSSGVSFFDAAIAP